VSNEKADNVLIEGLRSALIAFLIILGISFVLSIIVNFTSYERFNEIMSGTLGGNKGVTASSIIKLTFAIFNLSLFNTLGSVKLGLLIFLIIPIIAFWISNKHINNRGDIDITNIKIYIITSLSFGVLQFIMSLITAGEIVEDLNINFASIGNIISTILITFLLQVLIKVNYKSNFRSEGVKAFKDTYRIIIIIGAIVGLVAIVYGIRSQSKDIIMLLTSIIFLLPNVIAYTCFYMMGLTLGFNDKLQNALDFIGIDASLESMMIVRYIGVLVFVLIVIIVIYRMNKDRFIIDTIIYSASLGLFIGILAYLSKIDIKQIPILGTITISVNSLLLSIIIPIAMIWIIVLIYYLILKIAEIIRS
jgi:hypothetical protein